MDVELLRPEAGRPHNAFAGWLRPLPRRLRLLFIVGHRVTFGFVNHNGIVWSAAMAFWLVLSLPPLMIAVSSVATTILGREQAQQMVAEQVIANLPAEGQLVQRIVEQEIELTSAGGVVSLVLLLFAGSRVFAGLIGAIYVMWRHVEPVSFIRRESMRLLLAFIVGGLLIASGAAQVAARALDDEVALPLTLGGRYFLPALLVIAGLFITYRLVPRGRASWRTALLAAVLVAIALRVAQFVFSILLGRVMDFDEGYGPLAGVATLATWAFFASAIVIIGAELVATLDRHRLVHLPLPSSRRGDPRERGSADGIVESEPDEDQPPRT